MNIFRELTKYSSKAFKFECLDYYLKDKDVHVLDVGCGNHSPYSTKSYYPRCHYSGLDQSRSYNLDQKDFDCMGSFYEVDLSRANSMGAVPDDTFDCIILAHVIEHLSNGENILEELLKKLKRGGVMYIEFPGRRSIYLPQMRGPFFRNCLNFYDDSTHIRVYDRRYLGSFLEQNGCYILRSGVRHSFKRIILFPAYLLSSLVRFGCIDGGIFWDLLGFAEFVLVKKI